MSANVLSSFHYDLKTKPLNRSERGNAKAEHKTKIPDTLHCNSVVNELLFAEKWTLDDLLFLSSF